MGHIARVARLGQNAGAHAPAGPDQVVVYAGNRQQHRDWRSPLIHETIADDERAVPLVHGRCRSLAQIVERARESVTTLRYREAGLLSSPSSLHRARRPLG